MPLYTFLHNLLNVLVQIANKMGLQKNEIKLSSNKYILVLLFAIVGMLQSVIL
jgi:hypothetical protein